MGGHYIKHHLHRSRFDEPLGRYCTRSRYTRKRPWKCSPFFVCRALCFASSVGHALAATRVSARGREEAIKGRPGVKLLVAGFLQHDVASSSLNKLQTSPVNCLGNW